MSLKNILEKPIGSQNQDFINNIIDLDTMHFINCLIEQNSELSRELELADERLKLAEELVREATEKSDVIRAESQRIIDEAYQTAAKTAWERLSLAKQQAQQIVKEAEAVKNSVELESNRIISEAKLLAEKIKKQAEEIMNAAAAQADSIRRRAKQEANNILVDVAKMTKEQAVLTKKEAEQLRDDSKERGYSEPIDAIRQIHNRLHSAREIVGQIQAEATSGQEPIIAEKKYVLFEGLIELLVQPPINTNNVARLLKHLKQIHGIGILDLKRSSDHGIYVRLIVRTRVPLLNILKEVPEVEEANPTLRRDGNRHTPSQIGKIAVARSISVTMKRVKPWYESHEVT